MGLGPRNMAYVTPLLTNISLAEIRQMKEWDAINQKRDKIMDGITAVCAAVSLIMLTAALVVVATGAGGERGCLAASRWTAITFDCFKRTDHVKVIVKYG